MLRWNQTVIDNAASANSVVTSVTPSGGGALTLAATTFGSSTAQRLTITSAADISNRTFAIVGTGPDGNVLTLSAFTGPNATTVTTSVAFKSITSITISGAAAGAITVGNSATAESRMFVCDVESNPFSIGFGCNRTSGTFTVQHTFDDVLATSYDYGASGNTWYSHAVVAAQTASIDGNYAFPVRAVRFIVTAAGTVATTLIQSGGGWK